MNVRTLLITLGCFGAFACTPNVVSSENPDAAVDSGTLDAGGEPDAGAMDAGPSDAGMVDAGTVDAGPGPYPAPPYGVTVNRVIQNFTFNGYQTTGAGVKVNTLTKSNVDLQSFRLLLDPNGKPYRYLLLDISAGWCNPCNQEAQDLGLQGTKKALTASWATRGGLFFTVLVEGYNESTHAAPLAGDIETWANQHGVQSSLALDLTQDLITQGINPSAFPTNLVIELKTMTIVAAWYGIDSTYQKWEATLNAQ